MKTKYDIAFFDAIASKIDRAVKSATGRISSAVIYSAYKTADEDTDDERPIDNLDEIAVTGRVRLIGSRDEFYGGECSKDYKSEILENPTWLQVAVCADAMIWTTKDHHHCFLEGLDELPKNQQTEEGVTLYEFCMGS